MAKRTTALQQRPLPEREPTTSRSDADSVALVDGSAPEVTTTTPPDAPATIIARFDAATRQRMFQSAGRTQSNRQIQQLAQRIQRAPGLADAVAQAEDEVTDAEAANETAPANDAQSVDLQETSGGGGATAVADPAITASAGAGASPTEAPETPSSDTAEPSQPNTAGQQVTAAASTAPGTGAAPSTAIAPPAAQSQARTAGPTATAGQPSPGAAQPAGQPTTASVGAAVTSAPSGQSAATSSSAPSATPIFANQSAVAPGQAGAAPSTSSSSAPSAAPIPASPSASAGETASAASQTTSAATGQPAGETASAASQTTSAATGQPTAATTGSSSPASASATSAQPNQPQGAAAQPEDEELQRKTGAPIQRFVGPASPHSDPAFRGVITQVHGAATQQKAHEPGQVKADQAADAAQMPQQEKLGLAQQVQADAVAGATQAQAAQAQGGQAPGFNKAAFIGTVRSQIDQLTPSDPQKMENIESSGVFDGAKQVVDTQVQGGKQAAQGTVDDRLAESPQPGAIPDKTATPLQPNQPGAAPTVNGQGAAPKPRSPGEVEAPLQAESAGLDQQMATAAITDEQLKKSNEPQFQSAIDAKQQAQTKVASDLPNYRAGEQSTIGQAQNEADTQAQAGVGGMHATRTQAFGQVGGVQGTSKQRDEAKRAEIGSQIDQLYTSAKTDVEGILTSLDSKVDQEFSAGAAAAKEAAISYIKRETKSYKDKRYQREAEWYDVGAHVSGALTHLGDALTDMPPEYYQIFRQGRDLYTQQMDGVISRVADIVGDHLTRAKQRIEQGKQAIAAFVAKQPASLREVAQQAATQANERFGDLEQTVDSKADEVANSLAQRYVEQAQALDDELESMKQEDKGLLARAADAIGGVIATIRQIGQLLSSVLQRAADAVTNILKDPIQFLGNLISGIGQGLRQFGSNILTHLQTGLIEWLTGAVVSTGLTLPAQLDLPGIFNLVLQLLGLTWQNIRGRIVRGLGTRGEQVMGALEQAWEVIQIIRTEGLAGLWRFVQQMIGDLKTMVIDQIKTMVSEQVIHAGIEWIVGLLGGPAGAFIKAAQAIVRIVQWFMSNGARVMSLVNSVIDSVSAIASGNLSGAANFIEQALAKSIPVVISFLADLLGLGGISRKVQDIIRKVQEPINKAIDWVVQKAMAIGKRIMGVFKGGKGKGEERGTSAHDPATKDQRWADGIKAVHGLPPESDKAIGPALTGIKQQYGFDTLKPVSKGDHWQVTAIMRSDDKIDVKKENTNQTHLPDNVKAARGGANAAIEDIEKLIGKADIQEKLDSRKEEFTAQVEKLRKDFTSHDELLKEPDSSSLFEQMIADFLEMQRKASELKRAIRSAIAKETEPEEGEISIAGRQFRPIKERSKHGQPIYQEVGRNFFISPDVGSGDGGGAHIGGVWKGAASAAGLRSKTTRMGTYDANLNKIGG